MRYIGYEYGDPNYYDDSYFVMTVQGDIDDFVDYTNRRLVRGPYAVSHIKFFVDSGYRHHSHYRHWDHDPYYVGSVWVGCDWPGSEIWIDGIYYGIAPVLIPSIYIGHHWVWVYYNGYPCYQRYFYVGGYNRYYINVTIDSRYRDHRHRRHAFRNWRFHERRHRNEDGFREKAVRARQNRVRTRSLPSSMVLDFHERGVIKENSPMVKNARANVRSRAERSAENRVRVKDSERSKWSDREVKVKKRAEKEAENRLKSRKNKDFDRPVKSKYNIKDGDYQKRSDKSSKSSVKEKKSSNKSSKSTVKESKKSKKVKSTGKKSKSSYKKSDKKSSKSSGSKSSSDKTKRSVKSSKSTKRSDSDRGRRKW
jgi:hypothetical protein